MTTPARFSGPRAWMTHSFSKNREYLAKLAQAREPIAWGAPTVLLGSISIGPFEYALTCLAAGDETLALHFLHRGKWVLDQAVSRFGNDIRRDPIDLDRPRMALASRIGSILAPNVLGDPWSVPFDAYARYVGADGRELEESNAGRVLWALHAIFEGADDQYHAARALKLRSHRDLRQEMAFVPALADLSQDSNHPRWTEYEPLLARWLNPILRTESYASNFQDMMAGLLALVWAKHHLGRLDRDTVLATYFGETLSASVVVG